MICNNLKIFSQNVCKNSLIVNTILETQLSFDIIFLQEPPWSIIRTIPSSTSCIGEKLVGAPHYPNWLTFTRSLTNKSDFPRVLAYINIQVSCLCFSLQNNIFNHRDVLYISFINQGLYFFLINVYSDSSQMALKYLKNTETNISNVIIMTGDFNIRDSLWDSNIPFSFYFIHSNMLFNIADSVSLALSNLTENFPTRFLDNDQNLNSVLDLGFTWPLSMEFNHHHIHPVWRLTSDHAPITVDIHINDENIPTKWHSLVKGSDEEKWFIENLTQFIKNLNTSPIQDAESLEEVVQHLATNIEDIWFKYSKTVNITRHFKAWWNEDCWHMLQKYWQSCSLENWKDFKSMVKKSKHSFFNKKINRIANKECGPWKLMNWVKKHKIPAIEAIQYKGWLCIELEDLWNTLHKFFNFA